MPTLHEIFGNSVPVADGKYLVVRDKKRNQCQFISNIEMPPFISRCKKSAVVGIHLCPIHAYSVNYIDGNGKEHTARFDTKGKAEYFKRNNNWTECNYA